MRMLVAKVAVARGERKLLRAERKAIMATWPRWRRWAHRTLVSLGEMTWIWFGSVTLAWMAWAELGTGIRGY